MDTTHLDTLELHLSHERERLRGATTQHERKLRSVWVSQIEKEIAGERKLLGLPPLADISEDDLLKELGLD